MNNQNQKLVENKNYAKKESEIAGKSISFAIRIVSLYKYLINEHKEFVLSKQILRSGTSIGANIKESEYSSSRKDFINKLYISIKESNETLYWLELLYRSDYIKEEMYFSLKSNCEEVI